MLSWKSDTDEVDGPVAIESGVGFVVDVVAAAVDPGVDDLCIG